MSGPVERSESESSRESDPLDISRAAMRADWKGAPCGFETCRAGRQEEAVRFEINLGSEAVMMYFIVTM